MKIKERIIRKMDVIVRDYYKKKDTSDPLGWKRICVNVDWINGIVITGFQYEFVEYATGKRFKSEWITKEKMD